MILSLSPMQMVSVQTGPKYLAAASQKLRRRFGVGTFGLRSVIPVERWFANSSGEDKRTHQLSVSTQSITWDQSQALRTSLTICCHPTCTTHLGILKPHLT